MRVLHIDRYHYILALSQVHLFLIDNALQLTEVIRVLRAHHLKLAHEESVEDERVQRLAIWVVRVWPVSNFSFVYECYILIYAFIIEPSTWI